MAAGRPQELRQKRIPAIAPNLRYLCIWAQRDDHAAGVKKPGGIIAGASLIPGRSSHLVEPLVSTPGGAPDRAGQAAGIQGNENGRDGTEFQEAVHGRKHVARRDRVKQAKPSSPVLLHLNRQHWARCPRSLKMPTPRGPGILPPGCQRPRCGTTSVGTLALRIIPPATLPNKREATTPCPCEPSTTRSAGVISR